MSPMLIFLAIAAIFIAIATMATFGWRMVEKHTFSEFFVGQVIGEQKGKIPGFKIGHIRFIALPYLFLHLIS